MRIVIIGAGNAGRHLAAKLCESHHDIVLIDCKPEPLADVEARLDVLTIQGLGSSPCTLEEAEVAKADLVVAVTNSDEVNILACINAHHAGARYTVARVSNTDYLHPPKRFNLQKMGVSLVVSQQEECAKELYNILRMPGTKDVVNMYDGRVVATGIQIHVDSPLIMSQVKAFPDQAMIDTLRFMGVMRGDELFIPHGDTQFMIGDLIYVIGEPTRIDKFLDWASPEHVQFQKIIIAGGDLIGFNLAKLLEGHSAQIVLIEPDSAQANTCSEMLDRTLVMKGDPLAPETLNNAGILKEGTAFVALTNDDENNIISCLLAEKEHASFTLAQVNKPDYVPIIHNLSLLDRVVSSHLSMINAILHFVRGKNVMSASLLQHLPGELLDVVMPSTNKWVGKSIQQVKIPKGSIIATVIREGQVCPATGELVLRQGDRLIIFSLPEAVDKLESIFRK